MSKPLNSIDWDFHLIQQIFPSCKKYELEVFTPTLQNTFSEYKKCGKAL